MSLPKFTNYFFVFSIFIFFSCSGNFRYLKNTEASLTDSVTYKKKFPQEYTLKPGDVLTVKVYTYSEELNNVLAIGSQSQNYGSQTNTGSMYLTGYMLNDSGYIELPILGQIKVGGYSMPECRAIVKNRAEKFFKSPIVTVKSAGIQVFFIGEFNSQGVTNILKEKVDILDAIAMNGGLSEYADKKHLRVIRNEQEQYTEYILDLTDVSLLTSEKFYVFNDDKIIADPVKTKILRRNIQEYTFFLSAISSVITTTVLILNLQKND